MDLFLFANFLILISIGCYGFYHNRSQLGFLFLAFTLSLAGWNICVFFLEKLVLIQHVNLISQVKLSLALSYALFFYFFSMTYPQKVKNFFPYISSIVFFIFIILIFFTSYVSVATIEDGKIKFIDGNGYKLLGLYYLSLWCLSFKNIYLIYKSNRSYKTQSFFLLIGTGLFILSIMVFNYLLPTLGNYNFLIVGHYSSLIPSIFVFYVLTKHDFLETSIIIKPITSWLIVATLISTSYIFALNLNSYSYYYSLATILGLSFFWIVYAKKIQIFLITTARQKFIRGWYDRQRLVSSIKNHLFNSIPDRGKIFSIVNKDIISAVQIEKSLLIKAMRNSKGQISHYILKNDKNKNISHKISVDSPLITFCSNQNAAFLLNDTDKEIQEEADKIGLVLHKNNVAIIPFLSPETVEGILILGERSSGQPYTEKDLLIFTQCMHFVSSALYRLTPASHMEKIFFETKSKLTSMKAFAANIAHELRTPLATIVFGLHGIQNDIKPLSDKKDVDKKTNDYIYDEVTSSTESLIKVVNNAHHIINTLLNNVRSEKIDTSEFKYFDIADEVENTLNNYPFEGSSKKTVTFRKSNSFTISASSSLFQYVIINLLKNALYYVRVARKGKITISLKQGKHNNFLVFKDTGKGIPTEIQPKIFEEFFTSKPSAMGHGLGLSFCKRVMHAFGGEISCRSEEGEYTEFTLTFPKIDKV